MLITIMRPGSTGRRAPQTSRTRLTVSGAAALASVALLTAGPAQARIETPQDTGDQAEPNAASAAAFPARVTRTRVVGLYGVKVDGGWLLR